MEYLKFILAALALTGGALYLSGDMQTSTDDVQIFQSYIMWKSEFNQNFNGDEDQYRFGVFKSNYQYVQKAQAKGINTVGLNVMAALTNEEFIQKFVGGYEAQNEEMYQTFTSESNVNAGSVNWVAKGAVAPVQDQGQCGSCWAFGVVGGLEGIYQIKTGNLVKMSEQQLTSCDTSNGGCNGGNPGTAYNYTKKNGIQTEASYPYTSGTTGKSGTCNYNASDVVFRNTGYSKPRSQDPNAIAAALEISPLTKGIAASSLVFQLYSGGVLSSAQCGTQLDHAVLMTGMDANSWTIKNSWGTGWGNNGYLQIQRDTQNGPGVCGINIDTFAPQYNN